MRVKRKMYIAPAVIAAGKAAMTVANVGGTAMAAKDMMSGDKEEEKPVYDPQNTALSKQFSFGKAAINLATGLGKGTLNVAKKNKKSLAGLTAAGVGMKAGFNAAGNYADKYAKVSQGEQDYKPSKVGNLKTGAATIGAGALVAGNSIRKSNNKIADLTKKADSLTTSSKNLLKEGKTVASAKLQKRAAKMTTQASKLSKGKLKSAGVKGLLAAGVVAGGSYLARKGLQMAKEDAEKSYSVVSAAARAVKSTGFKKVGGQLMKQAVSSLSKGNFKAAGKNLAGAAKLTGSKVTGGALSLATFGKGRQAGNTMRAALKQQGGASAKVGNFLGKHKTTTALAGGAVAYPLYEVSGRVGDKIGDKIVKPIDNKQDD